MNSHTCPTCRRPWRCMIAWCALEEWQICPFCPDIEDKPQEEIQEVIANATQNYG